MQSELEAKDLINKELQSQLLHHQRMSPLALHSSALISQLSEGQQGDLKELVNVSCGLLKVMCDAKTSVLIAAQVSCVMMQWGSRGERGLVILSKLLKMDLPVLAGEHELSSSSESPTGKSFVPIRAGAKSGSPESVRLAHCSRIRCFHCN